MRSCDLDPCTVRVGEIEGPDVLGIHVRTEIGRQHGAVRQYKTVRGMNVVDLKVDVVHGADGGAIERPGVDHQLDDVVALARKHEFHQAQVSRCRLVSPELRATNGVAIEVEHGLQLVTLHDDAYVLQMARYAGRIEELGTGLAFERTGAIFDELDARALRRLRAKMERSPLASFTGGLADSPRERSRR